MIDPEHKDLIRRLFVVAAELGEIVEDTAVEGQAARRDVENRLMLGRRLGGVARDLEALAATIVAVGRLDSDTAGGP